MKNFDAVTVWCKDNSINLVVVGPEDPLAAGISDHLTKNGTSCIFITQGFFFAIWGRSPRPFTLGKFAW